MQIQEWHIVIQGFRQRSGTLNGIVRIWGDLIQLVGSRRDARVELLSWNDNVANLAELISQIAPFGVMPIVNIYGYSWGGMTAMNFARELRRGGVNVNDIVLSDAVYRHWYWLGQWRAFVSTWAIRVPDNVVGEVTQFRQRQSYPMGHTVKADNPERTKLHDAVWLTRDHCWMDDAPEFREACRKTAERRAGTLVAK